MVSVAKIRPLFVVKLKPLIEIGLQHFKAGGKLFSHLDAKNVVHRLLDAFDKTLGLRMLDISFNSRYISY